LDSGLAKVVSSSDTKPSSVSSCTSFSTDVAAGGPGQRGHGKCNCWVLGGALHHALS
jgi:hypothetical protein